MRPALLVVDSLYSLVDLEPVAAAALTAAPRANSPREALERLRARQADFEAAQAPASAPARHLHARLQKPGASVQQPDPQTTGAVAARLHFNER